MTGGPAGATQSGVAGQVKFVSAHDAGTTVAALAAADGTFTVNLPADTYTVTGRSRLFQANQGVCHTAGAAVMVSAGVGVVTVGCERR